MDDGAGLPPPPPVPEGTVPSKAPGYGGGSRSGLAAGPSQSGPNGGGDGAGPSRSNNGGSGPTAGPSGGRGSAALAAPALLPAVPIPAKTTRPDYGKVGHPTKLCVNYFRAKLVMAEDVYHYNVSFSSSSHPLLQCIYPQSLWV